MHSSSARDCPRPVTLARAVHEMAASQPNCPESADWKRHANHAAFGWQEKLRSTAWLPPHILASAPHVTIHIRLYSCCSSSMSIRCSRRAPILTLDQSGRGIGLEDAHDLLDGAEGLLAGHG